MEKHAGTKGNRSALCMNPFFENLRGLSLSNTVVFNLLLNLNFKVRVPEDADELFKEAQRLIGTRAWEKYAKETGCKYLSLAMEGTVCIFIH